MRSQLISRRESMEEDARWIAVITGGAAGETREECFRKLMVKYWKLVTLLALQKVGDREEAEDVAQEAFFRAFRSIGSLHDPDLFLGWLLRIVRNLATDHLRARRPALSLDSLAPEGDTLVVGNSRREEPDFEKGLESDEEVEEVLKALAELPEKYREVITLRYVQNVDGKSMAKLLGEPEGTVRNRLFRALEKLRTLLEERKAHRP